MPREGELVIDRLHCLASSKNCFLVVSWLNLVVRSAIHALRMPTISIHVVLLQKIPDSCPAVERIDNVITYLNYSCRGRGSRSVLKRLKNGTVVHDASYFVPIQLDGPEVDLPFPILSFCCIVFFFPSPISLAVVFDLAI